MMPYMYTERLYSSTISSRHTLVSNLFLLWYVRILEAIV